MVVVEVIFQKSEPVVENNREKKNCVAMEGIMILLLYVALSCVHCFNKFKMKYAFILLDSLYRLGYKACWMNYFIAILCNMYFNSKASIRRVCSDHVGVLVITVKKEIIFNNGHS